MRAVLIGILAGLFTLIVLTFLSSLIGWAGPYELALMVLASTAVAAFVVVRARRTAN
jgi:hypothetical protein